MDTKNLGVLIASPRPSDYILGTSVPLPDIRFKRDWSLYLPAEENQRNKITDFLDCVSVSMLHAIECQLNFLLSSNQLSDEALNFFTNNNYLLNGSFELSARFNAKVNGTDITMGQYLNIAGDSVRSAGILPKSDWDMTDDMSFVEYYKMIPIGLFAKAKKALWFINIKYSWVKKEDFPAVIALSPIQAATEICPGWNSGQPVQKCSGQPLQHATIVYGIDTVGNYQDFDHYPPYKQLLASDYELPANMQYVVTVKPIALRNGMQGKNVLQLQQNLNKFGYNLKEDGIFGNITELAVNSFQNKYRLGIDGIAGPLTLGKIQSILTSCGARSLLDAIIEVESQGNDNAEGDKNLSAHAYGCLQIRQGVCDQVNAKFGTNYKSSECLGNRMISIDIWNKYWLVYPNIQENEDRARTWNGGPGWRQIYFKTQKTPEEIKYCQNIDIYWSKVKSLLN